jgi:hypothetical protein
MDRIGRGESRGSFDPWPSRIWFQYDRRKRGTLGWTQVESRASRLPPPRSIPMVENGPMPDNRESEWNMIREGREQ